MPQPKKGPRFGHSPAHHAHIMSNLTTELFRHGRIRTTHAKAKTVQPLAEKMITFAKRGDVHARRQVLRVVHDRDVVHKLFADIGPAFGERDGGYTRVLKLGPRKGDAAPMALIELVEGVVVAGEADGDLAEAPRRRWSLRRRRGGTLSATAREREEDLAAAVDRGEDPDDGLDDDDDDDDVEEVDEPRPSLAPDEGTGEDNPSARPEGDGVEADPTEVEARLAAEDEGATAIDDAGAPQDEGVAGDEPIAGPISAADQDTPAAERPADVDTTTPTTDEPEGGSEDRS